MTRYALLLLAFSVAWIAVVSAVTFLFIKP
jgi:hypothetical protein